MITPKINFLGISSLRIALKSQHSLTGVQLQNRQEIDLIPQQGQTWAILNETYCFWVNTSSQVKESPTVFKKNIQVLQDLKEWSGELPVWLQTLFGGSYSWWRGIWSRLMPLLIHVITILILLMIAPCVINCLSLLSLPRSTSYKNAVLVQQGYIQLNLTTENIYHSPFDRHHCKDSETSMSLSQRIWSSHLLMGGC